MQPWPIPWRTRELDYPSHLSFGGSDDKESAYNSGDSDLIPGLGRSPGGGHENPLQYSCLENPHGRGTWRATVPGGSQESMTRLSHWTRTSHILQDLRLCICLSKGSSGRKDTKTKNTITSKWYTYKSRLKKNNSWALILYPSSQDSTWHLEGSSKHLLNACWYSMPLGAQREPSPPEYLSAQIVSSCKN